jgi:hypothetical protein
MAIAKRYLGEDIYLSIKKRAPDLSYRNLDSYADIFVYVSNGGNIVKFSKNIKTGYTLLRRISSTEYALFLTSSDSQSLDIGHISVSLDFIETSLSSDLRINNKSTEVCIRLDSNPISPER